MSFTPLTQHHAEKWIEICQELAEKLGLRVVPRDNGEEHFVHQIAKQGKDGKWRLLLVATHPMEIHGYLKALRALERGELDDQ